MFHQSREVVMPIKLSESKECEFVLTDVYEDNWQLPVAFNMARKRKEKGKIEVFYGTYLSVEQI